MNRYEELKAAAANAPDIATFARVCMQAEKELPPIPCDLTDELLKGSAVSVISLKNPQVVVFRHRSRLDRENVAMIREGWKQAVAGTSLEHVKCLILCGGCEMSIVDGVTE